MKKTFLLLSAVAMTLCIVYSSCKKTTHSTNATPSNTRLLSYTKISSSVITYPLPNFIPVVQENYSFLYDGSNRVSSIIYSTNDSGKVNHGLGNLVMSFSYSGDTTMKIITRPDRSVVDTDYFITNAAGQITNTYLAGIGYTYEYNGKLLFKVTETSYDSLTSLSTVSTYTSSSGNFLKETYDDNLNITITGLTPSITLYWTFYTPALGAVIQSTLTQTGGSTQQLANYSRVPDSVMAVDGLNDTARGSYPGGIWTEQDFTFTGDYNRTGDYLQLGSFTTYGANVYQNVNLVKSIKNSGYTTNITYTIDAQSKITQTSVVQTDSLQNTYSQVYNLQYETY